VRGSGKVHVLQGSGAASLRACVERDLYVVLEPEHARKILDFFAQNLLSVATCKTDAVFAALVCHAIRAPEDIVLLVTQSANAAYIIEFFSVKVTEGCTFFGVWLLAGLLGACVEKHVPMPPELESLVCSIGPRGFARALKMLEEAAVAGRTVTPLSFSLYFWHLLVTAVDQVFDQHARRALAAAAPACATGVSQRFAELLVGALESREERREEQRARAQENADALLQELEREEHTGGHAGKGRRSRRQRRAAKGVVASGDVPSAGGAVGARAADATDVVAIVDGRRYTSSPVGVLHNSRMILVTRTLNAGELPSDAGSQWRSWPDLRILPDSPLVWSGFPDLRDPLQQPAGEGMLWIETYRNSTQATFHNLPDIRHFSTEAKEYVYSMPATIPQYSMPARIPQPLNMHAFSAMAMQCLLDELRANSRASLVSFRANSRASLASSGFAESRSSWGDVVAFRGGDRLQPPCAGAGVRSTSPVNPPPHLASQQRLRIAEACAEEIEDKGVRAKASDDSARAAGHTRTNFAECAVCLEEVEKEKLVVLVPCGHVCMCKNCASSIASCPICRAKVQQVVTPFYS
jgi:hypothetical protein